MKIPTTMPTTRCRSGYRDRYTEELYDGDVREKKITKQDPRERDLLNQPAQGFHIIVLIQECYEHGSKWAIILWGIDTGVRLEVQDVLDQIHLKYIFMSNSAGMQYNVRSKLPTIDIMTKSHFVSCISARNGSNGLSHRAACCKLSFKL